MRFTLTNQSDRQLTAGALRLYAEDCRSLAALYDDFRPALTTGAQQAERLANAMQRLDR